MPASADVVRRKLATVREAVERLRAGLPVTIEALAADGFRQWAIERGLQVAAEALFDAGTHILVGEFAEAVDEYRRVPERLAARGVLSTATAARLRSLSGFRNVLVHEYAAIDRDRLIAGLARLGDFEAFVADVEAWLSDHRVAP